MKTAAGVLRPLSYGAQTALLIRRSNEKAVILGATRANLPASRDRFLDIGGGTGALTRPLSEHFGATTILDPSPGLDKFYLDRPQIGIIERGLDETAIDRLAGSGAVFDYILMSHMLYHIDQTLWPELISGLFNRLLAPSGTIHIFMQAVDSEGARIFNRYAGSAGLPPFGFDLRACAKSLRNVLPLTARIEYQDLASWIRTDRPEEIFQIALFFAGDPLFCDHCGIYQNIYSDALSQYAHPKHGFEMINQQDFLCISKSQDED